MTAWTRLCTFAAALAISTACGGGSREQEAKPPSLVPAPPPRSAPPPPADVRIPVRPVAIRFAVIGDSGRGDRAQYDVAEQMVGVRQKFPYSFVVMAGDNVYDGGTPEDYRRKFEVPYKPLLDADVNFYAVIGNHDDPNQQFYEPFNTGGQRYYTFKKETLGGIAGPSVRFFMLDTERLDEFQLQWLRVEGLKAQEDWKIAVFHRPIYTSGRYARPARLLRALLEPVLRDVGIDVVFSGHEHFYERIKPQHGITYFVTGAAGALRAGDIRPSELTAAGFDADNHFMVVELTKDDLFFQAISRTGTTVDEGRIERTDHAGR